jgi:predicted Zn-dependent protease
MRGVGTIVRTIAVIVAACAAWTACAAGARAQGGTPPTKSVDTGLGITLSLPETWTRAQPYKNNKFVAGSADDDFSVLVADFGPAQTDAAEALTIYRESFLKNGLAPETETEMTIGGTTVRRYVLRLDTPAGPGHAEAAMVRVGDEMYAVVVVTPSSSLEARRATIAKILESIVVR